MVGIPKNKNKSILAIIIIVNISSILYNYINFELNTTSRTTKPKIPAPHIKNELLLHPQPPPFNFLNGVNTNPNIAAIINRIKEPKNIIGNKFVITYVYILKLILKYTFLSCKKNEHNCF